MKYDTVVSKRGVERTIEVRDIGSYAENPKPDVRFAISDEQKLLQIKLAVARGLPALKPGVLKHEPLSVMCYGPSLKDTFHRAQGPLISMSGSHDFLIERGIIPSWHIETDPRRHKREFLRKPHPSVIYLISSCCHPSVFDALAGFNVKLLHLYQNEPAKDLPNLYRPGDWSIYGGSNVGLRALVVGRVLGFTKMHIFGMDCSFPEAEGTSHAGPHPNPPVKREKVIVGEKAYYTTQVLREYARQFWHETRQLPDVSFTLHGVGLLQNIVANKLTEPMKADDVMRELKKPNAEVIAISPGALISDKYLQLNRKLHENPSFGIGGIKRARTVLKMAELLKTTSVLDYGCGKGTLAAALPFPIWEYDPAIVGKSAPARPADIVVCTDVLEHIEPAYLDRVLADLRRVTLKVGYLVIATRPAQKVLEDGRNAHLIVKPSKWWVEKLKQYFTVGRVEVGPGEVQIILGSR